MEILLFSILLLGVFGQTDICMPNPVHSYGVEFERFSGGGGEHEYESGFFRSWYDKTAKFIRVEWAESRDHDHHKAELLDYNKLRRYEWQNVDGKIHCTVWRIDTPMEDDCVAKAATLTGSGTIGESGKVDFYHAITDREGDSGDIQVVVESGTKIPISSDEKIEGNHQWFYDSFTYFDVSTDEIPSKTWTPPDECPLP